MSKKRAGLMVERAAMLDRALYLHRLGHDNRAWQEVALATEALKGDAAEELRAGRQWAENQQATIRMRAGQDMAEAKAKIGGGEMAKIQAYRAGKVRTLKEGITWEQYKANYPDAIRFARPSNATVEKWVGNGVALAVDGCRVEPDGHCPHGYPSKLLLMGLI